MQTKKTRKYKVSLPAMAGVLFLLLLLFFAGITVFLTACGEASEDCASPGNFSQGVVPDDQIPSDTLALDDSPFHSVPYFQDDTGKSIQSFDGFLYGYWNGQLCRYDADTLEQYCYFSAESDQFGQFCIYEGNIYFLERPSTASLTGVDTCLYMAALGKKNRKLLTTQVPNTTAEYSNHHSYYDYYEIDIYDDIIYLISDKFQENVYYRLDAKLQSVTRAEKSETLYGQLPEGYKEPVWYSNLPTLPYQMRHYGYLFLMDDSGKLAACDVESGRLESIDFPTDNIAPESVFLTNDALYCAEKAEFSQLLTTWYRISLDDLHSAEEWGQLPPMQYTKNIIFYDESGVYFAERKDSVVSLYKIPWDGSSVSLLYSRYLAESKYFLNQYLCYTDGDYFYFNDKKDSQYCIMRASLQGNASEAEILAIYYEDLSEEICIYDTQENTCTVKTDADEKTDALAWHTVFTRLFLTGDTAGDYAINDCLNNVYREIQKELDSFEASCDTESEYDSIPGGLDSYMQVTAYSDYLDDNYIGITIAEETYYSGAAHPNTWSEKYVFDRRTGSRISITDIVENSPEEICEIVAAYVERDYPGFRSYESQENRAGILEDFRFFLSKEGIGIHFNTYELGSYAEGDADYIIPFWEFNLKPDTILYLNIEKVRYCYYSWLETKEPPFPGYMEELENMLTEQMKAGTLLDFLTEHASGYRELSFEEILEKMAADQNGVLKQYYISGKQPGDEWFCLKDSEDIWIRQTCEQDGAPCWKYYRFPRSESGYITALDARSSGEEFYFLAWEGTDYLVTVDRDSEGNVAAVSTYCLLADSVYNGWILRHTIEKNGEITVNCQYYWM